MTDEQGYSMDQIEFMKRMKAIASDLWGGSDAYELPEPRTEEAPVPETVPEKKDGIENLWKTADETIDWTDALAHTRPTDGLTGEALWAFYHGQAEKVLDGDTNAYAEVLKTANPLGDLTEYAEGITVAVPSADRLEGNFICSAERMEKDKTLYLAAMGLRIARDLLACLPVCEVAVKGEHEGKTVFEATYQRKQLLNRNFLFIDPVAFSKECGATFGKET